MIPFTHMKRFYVIMSALLLTLMGTEVLAQKKDSNSDYNLQKAYEVLKEEKDEAKALDLRPFGYQPCPQGQQAEEERDACIDPPLVESIHLHGHGREAQIL